VDVYGIGVFEACAGMELPLCQVACFGDCCQLPPA